MRATSHYLGGGTNVTTMPAMKSLLTMEERKKEGPKINERKR